MLNGEFEAQDLILSESKFFRGHTAHELANKAAAEQFLSSIAVQQLLTDIWHGKINPYLSSFRVIFKKLKIYYHNILSQVSESSITFMFLKIKFPLFFLLNRRLNINLMLNVNEHKRTFGDAVERSKRDIGIV